MGHRVGGLDADDHPGTGANNVQRDADTTMTKLLLSVLHGSLLNKETGVGMAAILGRKTAIPLPSKQAENAF